MKNLNSRGLKLVGTVSPEKEFSENKAVCRNCCRNETLNRKPLKAQLETMSETQWKPTDFKNHQPQTMSNGSLQERHAVQSLLMISQMPLNLSVRYSTVNGVAVTAHKTPIYHHRLTYTLQLASTTASSNVFHNRPSGCANLRSLLMMLATGLVLAWQLGEGRPSVPVPSQAAFI